MSNSPKNEAWFEERIEAFIDGELPSTEAVRFEQRLQTDSGLARSVAQARELGQLLHQVQCPRAPAAIKSKVLDDTGTHWFNHHSAGWAVATAATLALVVSVAWRGQTDLSPPATDTTELQLTAREIARGRQDLAVALAYLDQATVHASRKVSSTWVNDGLMRPVSSGLNRPSNTLGESLQRLPLSLEDGV